MHHELELTRGVVIDRLPYDLTGGYQVRGFARGPQGLMAWVVNPEGEGTWWTMQDLRSWQLLEELWPTG